MDGKHGLCSNIRGLITSDCGSIALITSGRRCSILSPTTTEG